MKFLTTILIVYSLLIGNVFGAVISDDTVKIGKPGSTANKEITLGTSKKIRANETTGKLEFSNDGSLYKNLGSGSGTGGSSGIMLNENDSFEDGLAPGWTSSGGTFTQQTYTNSSTDDTKYAQFVATASGQYFETTAKVIPTNFSAGCQADIKKVNTTAANLFKIDVIDGSANILATANIGLLTWQKLPTLSFPCPTTGSTVKLRVTSLAAGTILVDRGYIGSNQNLIYSSQAKLIGTMTVNNCAAGWTTTSTTLASFGAQSGCTYTVTGELLAPLTNIPAFRVPKLLAGDYRIEYEGAFSQTSAAKSGWVKFTDGVNLARELSAIYSVSGQVTVPSVSQTISYATTQSNVTMELKGYTESGGTTTIFGVTTTPATFKLWYFPSSSEVAISPEQSSWYIDANIGGANIGSTITASYIPWENTSLDMVVNPGSSTVTIPCSGTNPDTGTTCAAGSEQVGASFIPPWPGVFEACAYANVANTGSSASGSVQWIETPTNAQTILQEGKSRTFFTGNSGAGTMMTNCGIFTFNDVSKRTLRLAYETNNSAFSITADRLGSTGQPDIHIVIRPLLSAFNRPILTGDQVTSKGATNPMLAGFAYGQSGVAGANCTSGNCLSFTTDTTLTAIPFVATGQYGISFSRTLAKVACVINSVTAGTDSAIPGNVVASCTNCNSLQFSSNSRSGGTSANSTGTGICTGY